MDMPPNSPWRVFQKEVEQTQKRRIGGRKAKKSGESAEELMRKMGQFYLKDEVAELRKRPEPYRRIGATLSNGQFIAAPLAKSGPDFDLTLPDGRSGLIEVKSRKGKRISLKAVGEVQSDTLQRRIKWNGFGVITVMLWDHLVDARWWVIDWRRWNEAKKRGYKSLSDADLDQIAVPCTLQLGGLPHWLPALFKAHDEATQCIWPLNEE